ncbi:MULTISPECIES: penicillin-binding transpeptidase domain-containing protein [Bacillaceae]|uniref:penicillin-binding transpeptidase domain-containing protein n=1 Tax=Bacillaceae TaxID=186817 RepID=UPI001CEFABA2|nr:MULTISPECIES: penicillin-binding transpeptidase domain-containing protein [Bacillaceae]
MKVKKTIWGSIGMLLMVLILAGCNETVSPEERLKEYINLWNDQKFDKMYSNYVADSAKDKFKKEQYVDRYQKVYKDLEISDLSVKSEFKDEKELKRDQKSITLPIQVKMNSLAGPIEFEKEVTMKLETKDKEENWYVDWDTTYIFPELQPDDKIGIKTTTGKRGEILDRNGNGLAINGIAQTVGITPEKFDESKKAELTKLLNLSNDYIDKQLNQSWVQPGYFVPIKTIQNNQTELIEKLKVINGVSFQEKEIREYPYGESAAHLTGYVGTITAEELEKNKDKGYSNDSIIGKRGLEQLLEDKLRPKDGNTIYINREDDPIVIAETEAEDGESFRLVLDGELQKQAFQNMKGAAGTFAAVHPNTGDVLALVSSPSFNPNDFVLGISSEKYSQLENDKKLPLLNRFAAAYSPGSTIKPIIAAIGLKTGKLDPEKQLNIKGLKWSKGKEWGNASITRVSDPGKPVNLQTALQISDNIYFAQTALSIGETDLINGFKELGIGEEKFPLEYPVRASQYSNSGKLESSKLLADTGYGQGEVLMSAVHLSSIYGTIVNDGKLMKPRLYLDTETAVWHDSFITAEQAKTLKTDLRKVVTSGTGKAANTPKLELAGKTGTAELKSTQGEEGIENGLFVAYDQKNPKAVMALLIEDVQNNGGGKNVQSIVQKTFLDWDSSEID